MFKRHLAKEELLLIDLEADLNLKRYWSFFFPVFINFHQQRLGLVFVSNSKLSWPVLDLDTL